MNELNIGGVFPGWEADGVLGSGAFGTVYLAHTLVDSKPVYAAIKVIKTPPTAEAVTNAETLGISKDLLKTYFGKFKNELNWELTMFKTVSSQNLVNVDAIAMEDMPTAGWVGYIRSAVYTPLNTYFESVSSTSEDAARLGAELSSALEALSEYGMVHGEIKPENVLVADSGNFLLADYGVKRCLEKAGAGLFGLTESEYEAPEIGEERKYTQSADIYALGMLMCYVANGCSLPENNDPYKIPNIDVKLAAIIKRATAENPEDRYQSAAEMNREITRLPIYTRRRPQRMAMASAVAFDLVKKNGSTIRNVTPTAPSVDAVPAAPADTTPTPTVEEPKAQEEQIPEEPVLSPEEAEDAFDKAVQDSKNSATFSKDTFKNAFSDKTDYAAQEEKRDIERKKVTKKTGAIAIAAVVIIIAIILALLAKGKSSGNDETVDDPKTDVVDTVPSDNENADNADSTENGEDDKTSDEEKSDSETSDDKEPSESSDSENSEAKTDENTTAQPSQETESQSTDNENKTSENNTQSAQTGNNQSSSTQTTTGQGSANTSSTTNKTNTSSNTTTATTTTTQKVSTYVIKNSDSVLITRSDLEGMSRADSYTAINEIYARHGKIFTDKTVQKYFDNQSWYTPVTKDSATVTAQFNETEKANVATLTDYQKEMGYRETESTTETSISTTTTTTDSSDTSTDTETTPDNGYNGEVNDVEPTYILPTNTQLITRADLEGMSREESYRAINEIYARYGKIFTDKSMQAYFESQSWYTAVTEDSSKITSQFTEIEYANLHTLTAYQREMGYRS